MSANEHFAYRHGEQSNRFEIQHMRNELNYLSQHESRKAFHHDLTRANEDLHKHGFPQISFAESGHGLRIHPSSSEQSKSVHRPNGNRSHQVRGDEAHASAHDGRDQGDGTATKSKRDILGDLHDLAVKNAKIVEQVAQKYGVDPITAVATMLVESKGDNNAIGDHRASVGLFQLNKYGEGKGLSMAQKTNSEFNANVALSHFRNKLYIHNPGEQAAAAQKPKHKFNYARRVNAMLPEAKRLLED